MRRPGTIPGLFSWQPGGKIFSPAICRTSNGNAPSGCFIANSLYPRVRLMLRGNGGKAGHVRPWHRRCRRDEILHAADVAGVAQSRRSGHADRLHRIRYPVPADRHIACSSPRQRSMDSAPLAIFPVVAAPGPRAGGIWRGRVLSGNPAASPWPHVRRSRRFCIQSGGGRFNRRLVSSVVALG